MKNRNLLGLVRTAGLFVMGLTCFVTGHAVAATLQKPSITWQPNVVEAYGKAIQGKKPLVIYFYKDNCKDCGGRCRNCKILEDNVLSSEAMAAFDSQAIFVGVDTSTLAADSQESKLMKALNIERVPSVVMLNAKPAAIEEVGCLQGEFLLVMFLEHFSQFLRKWEQMQLPPLGVAAQR